MKDLWGQFYLKDQFGFDNKHFYVLQILADKPVLLKFQAIIEQMGENIKLARSTLYLVEKGILVSQWEHTSILHVLGLQDDFLEIGRRRCFGRKL